MEENSEGKELRFYYFSCFNRNGAEYFNNYNYRHKEAEKSSSSSQRRRHRWRR